VDKYFYPSISTYAVLIHVFCKKGKLEEACKYIANLIVIHYHSWHPKLNWSKRNTNSEKRQNVCVKKKRKRNCMN